MKNLKKYCPCLLLISLLLLTNLNAQTWIKKQEGSVSSFVNRMCFTSASIGYSTLGDNTGGVGSILKTTDFGSTWTQINAACTNATYGITFPNASTGFCCSFNGEIAKTTNAGANWTKVYQNSSSFYLYTIGSFDANTIFSAGNSIVARTTNGGTDWTEISAPGFIYSSAVLSSTKAFICGTQSGSDGGVWASTNAGASWTYSQISTNILYDIFFIDANTGFVGGASGILYKTTNGGSNWTPLTSGTTNTISTVYFQNTSIGFIAGSSGFIMKTTDGGTNWNSVNTFPTITGQSIYDIYFSDANNGIICNGSGSFFKTTNAGTAWGLVGNNLLLNAICFTNSLTGFTAGESSVVQKTTDGGNTWQNQLNVPTTVTLYCMSFPNSLTGFIAGLSC